MEQFDKTNKYNQKISNDVANTNLPSRDIDTTSKVANTTNTSEVDQSTTTPVAQQDNSVNNRVDMIARLVHQGLWAKEIQRSINSGDSEKLLQNLHSIPEGEMEGVKSAYTTYFQSSLIEAAIKLLPAGSTHFTQAMLLLDGKKWHAEAAKLFDLANATPPNFTEIIQVLKENVANNSIMQLSESYRDLTGNNLDLSKSTEFSKNQLQILNSVLANDTNNVRHYEILELVTSGYLDQDSIVELISKSPPITYNQINEVCLESYGKTIDEVITKLPPPYAGEAIIALLKGDEISSKAYNIKSVINDPNLTEKDRASQLVQEILSLPVPERNSVLNKFQEIFNQPFLEAASSILYGAGSPTIQETLATNLSPEAERILFALKGLGDVNQALSIVSSMKSDNITALDEQVKQHTGASLNQLIQQHLKGVDQFELSLALLGAPATLQEEQLLTNARHYFERNGANALSAKILDLLTSSGLLLDDSVSKMNKFFQDYVEYQEFINEAEEGRFYALLGIVDDDLQQYRKDRTRLAARGARSSSIIAALVSFFAAEAVDFWAENLDQPLIISLIIALMAGILADKYLEPYLANRLVTANNLVDKVKKRRLELQKKSSANNKKSNRKKYQLLQKKK